MASCTWVDCTEHANFPQKSKDGSIWANLCSAHNKELDDSLLDPKGVLRCWVRASGGAKSMAARMMEEPATKNLIKAVEKYQSKRRR